MTFARDLVSEFDDDLRRAWPGVVDEYVLAVRTDPAMPEDTGNLSAGITPDVVAARGGRASATVESLARSDDGADYGTILDRSTGRKVTRSGGGAFGPFKSPVPTASGPTRFLTSFRVTTKHVGWWDAVNSDRNWRDALARLSRFDL